MSPCLCESTVKPQPTNQWQAFACVHLVCLSGCQPSDQPSDFGCESASRLLLSISTIEFLLLVFSQKADFTFYGYMESKRLIQPLHYNKAVV